MRAVFPSMLLAGAILISNGASSANLPLRMKPALQREGSQSQEERKLNDSWNTCGRGAHIRTALASTPDQLGLERETQ
jgi:hypothetical protein